VSLHEFCGIMTTHLHPAHAGAAGDNARAFVANMMVRCA
jgi:hypothetical protein